MKICRSANSMAANTIPTRAGFHESGAVKKMRRFAWLLALPAAVLLAAAAPVPVFAQDSEVPVDFESLLATLPVIPPDPPAEVPPPVPAEQEFSPFWQPPTEAGQFEAPPEGLLLLPPPAAQPAPAAPEEALPPPPPAPQPELVFSEGFSPVVIPPPEPPPPADPNVAPVVEEVVLPVLNPSDIQPLSDEDQALAENPPVPAEAAPPPVSNPPPPPPGNHPPTIEVPGALVVDESTALSFTVHAADEDAGQTVSVQYSALPAGAALADNHDGTWTFAWTPTYTQAGTYTVNFLALDNGNPALYSTQAASVTIAVNNLPAEQTISFEPLTDKTYGDAPFVLRATASSGLPVSFAVNAEPAEIATIAGNQLTLTGVGTVTVTASQAGNGDFRSAPVVVRSFAVIKQHQDITFAPLDSKTFGDEAFTVSATASSGLAVSYTVSGPASISGNTITLTGAGQVTVSASQAGNGDYAPAVEMVQSFAVSKASATITLANLNCVYDGQAKSPIVTTTPAELNGVVVTYPGGAVAPTEAGNYEVIATLDNPNYQGSSTGVLVIAKAPQSIAFDALPDKVFGDIPFPLSARASSRLPVGFTVAGPAVITGNLLAITGTGTVTVTALQAGNANYETAVLAQSFAVSKATALLVVSNTNTVYDGSPKLVTVVTTPPHLSGVMVTYDGRTDAPTDAGSYAVAATLNHNNYQGSATGTLEIAKATQAISFGTLDVKTTLDLPFPVSASASSGLPVGFAVQSGPASINGNTVTITGAGTVTVVASQQGNSNYLPALSVTQSFAVLDKTPPTVTAALTAISRSRDEDEDEDGNFYRISATAVDLVDPRPVVAAQIAQPLTASTSMTVVYKRENKNRIKIQIEKKKLQVTLSGPSEQGLRALWGQVLASGGFSVSDGQQLQLVLRKDKDQYEAQYQFDRNLKLTSANGPGLSLVVWARDASGNRSQVQVSPSKSGSAKVVSDGSLPAGFSLEPSYPNPFNPTTTLQYSLAEAGLVQLTVYNVMGQRVRVLIDQVQQAGGYQVEWDATDASGQRVAPGLYLYRLTAGDQAAVGKMLLLK